MSKPNVRQLVMIILGVLPLLALDQFSKRLAITQLKGTPGVAFIQAIRIFSTSKTGESAFNRPAGFRERFARRSSWLSA
ncbi:MAG: hypothetical protein IPO15_18500 [Anaerolineae bacterium]|uniref:hypothetical protein n=1 Tax=Candidatus Amarolinea dominans TaxID=3140696 RepID=UPI0031351F08|nr:hypothetical protein [Anaerolineae bacterium]